MTTQPSNTAARPSDAYPDCPECETNVLVDATQFDAMYRCRGCDERFGRNRRPIAWHAPDAWRVSSNPRGRTRAHANADCPDLAHVSDVLRWDARNVRAADLPRCKRCSYVEDDT